MTEGMETQLDRIEAKLDRLLKLAEKRKREPKSVKAEYDGDFERFWTNYPKRAGSNPKVAAYKAFCARLKEGVMVNHMVAGAIRYGAFCKATGKTGTEYVMQAVRFLGPRQEYENDWKVPELATVPKTDDEWMHYGQVLGIQAQPGESMAEYKQRLMGARR